MLGLNVYSLLVQGTSFRIQWEPERAVVIVNEREQLSLVDLYTKV